MLISYYEYDKKEYQEKCHRQIVAFNEFDKMSQEIYNILAKEKESINYIFISHSVIYVHYDGDSAKRLEIGKGCKEIIGSFKEKQFIDGILSINNDFIDISWNYKGDHMNMNIFKGFKGEEPSLIFIVNTGNLKETDMAGKYVHFKFKNNCTITRYGLAGSVSTTTSEDLHINSSINYTNLRDTQEMMSAINMLSTLRNNREKLKLKQSDQDIFEYIKHYNRRYEKEITHKQKEIEELKCKEKAYNDYLSKKFSPEELLLMEIME